MTSKIQNSLLTDRYGNPFEVGIINFITQFGNYMQKTPYLKIHGAYSKYVDMPVTYITMDALAKNKSFLSQCS
jgi:hypothetical protein